MRLPYSLSSLLTLSALLHFAAWLVPTTARAQAWAWAHQTVSSRAGGVLTERHFSGTDAPGSIYTAFAFTDTTQCGPLRLIAPRRGQFGGWRSAVAVTKLSAGGQWNWATTVAGNGWSDVDAMTTDPAGTTALTGFYEDTVRFGQFQLVSPAGGFGNWGRYVARISTAGQWLGAVDISYGAQVRAMAIDPATQDVVLTGVLSDSATFGSTHLYSRGEADTFVARLSPTGQWRWAIRGGGADEDGALGLALAPDGTAYVTGGFGAGADFGSIYPAAQGWIDGYVAAVSPGGAWRWLVPIPAQAACLGTTLTLAPGGDVLLGGIVLDGAVLGGTTIPADTLSNSFVARLDTTFRAWRWVAPVANAGTQEAVWSIATDAAGAEVYAAGTFGGLGTGFPQNPGPIASLTLGGITLAGYGAADGFVAHLDGQTGTCLNAVAWGGPADDFSGQVHSVGGRATDVVLTGSFLGPTATAGPFALATNPAAQSAAELLVARLSLPPLGVAKLHTAAEISLAPNPAHHIVRLTGAPAGPVRLLDATGRVAREWASAAAPLDLRGLAAGRYVVRAGALARRLVVVE